jgi:hypothetical protein
MTTLKVLTFNMFADGLSEDGVVSRNPKHINWKVRGPRILAILNKAFNDGYDIVSVNENDHFLYLLDGLQSDGKNIHGSFQRVRDAKKNTNNAYKLLFNRNYKFNKETGIYDQEAIPDNTFVSDIRNASDCCEFVVHMNSDKPADPESIPNFFITDAYVSDYGNSLYWNAKTVTSNPTFEEFNAGNTTRKYKCYFGAGDNGFIQTFYKNKVEINVLSAHLPSGEGEKNELKRVDVLRYLLSKFDGKTNPVLLMDSNSSRHYRDGMQTTIETVLDELGYANAIVQDGANTDAGNRYQTVKLRDGNGDQEEKYGGWMFDTLELIGAKKGVKVTVVPIDGVEMYPLEFKDYMYRFRTDDEVRHRIINWVLNWDNRRNANGEYVSGGSGEIRPGGSECVSIQNKEKTVTLRMMSKNKLSRWGANARTNAYEGMAEYLGIDGLTDDKLKKIFLNLYPNDKMPSDHPPVGAIIRFGDEPVGWLSYMFANIVSLFR